MAKSKRVEHFCQMKDYYDLRIVYWSEEENSCRWALSRRATVGFETGEEHTVRLTPQNAISKLKRGEAIAVVWDPDSDYCVVATRAGLDSRFNFPE